MSRVVPAVIQSVVGLEVNKPIELFEVYLDQQTLFMAANVRDVTVGTSVYTALGLQRSAIRTTMELEVDELTISLDNINLAFSQRVIAEQFVGRRLIVKKAFLSHIECPGQLFTMFKGRMDDPVITERTLQVKVRSELDALHHELPRRQFSTLCNYQHYDSFCTVPKCLYVNLTTGTALVQAGFNTTTATIVSSALGVTSFVTADNYWAPIGTLTFKTGSNANLGREVTAHYVGSLSVNVRIPFPYDPASGDVFEITRGCRKSVSDCQSKYDNYLNYGGFPVTPKTPLL